jgi:hypothetical protein
MKDLALQADGYTVKVEEVLGAKFIHCDINGPWTKTKKAALRADFNRWQRALNEPVYATHYPEQGKKHEKFLAMFDFVKLTAAVDSNLRPTEIWAKLTIPL